MSRKARPLPNAEDFPHSLVRITVWEKVFDTPDGGSYSGKGYFNTREGWVYDRNMRDVLPSGTEVMWSFDGFRLDYFNRGYLLQPDQNTPEIIKTAMWALDRWAIDQGLIEKQGDTN
jgi:hypothetical protein